MSFSTSETTNTFISLWDFVSQQRRRYIDRNGFIFACYYETLLNIDIIDSVALINEGDIKDLICSYAFLEFLNGLEINATQAIMYGSSRFRYRRFKKLIKRHWGKKIVKLEDEGDNDIEKTINTAIQSFGYVARKVEVLRRISAYSNINKELLGNILLDKRLRNIRKALVKNLECLQCIIRKIDN